ncbi:MAG: prephenate dehydrogenase [Vicinamibacterales bacterium]
MELDQTPPFNRIGIVGLGLIGGSIALGARHKWPSSLVIGVDSNEVLERAHVARAIDVAGSDLDMLAEVDLVILAAPVLTNIEILTRLPEIVTGDAVVTDVGSTKAAIVQAAQALPERLAFVGGHPLAGAARGGIGAARVDLFHQRPWVLTPDGASEAVIERLERFARGFGAEPRRMAAADHDRITGWVSHLPQLTASALMRVVGDAVGEDGLELAGRGLRDTTRLADSPSTIWVDVCRTNRATIADALDHLVAELQRLRDGLDDAAAVESTFEAAVAWRKRME